ncbi:microprocessor complex subunit DGCR8-like [Diadema setosum]|uniref:microprocessor complex subunit DGCR8-like n=1 Tax=Diadema setosum TaxID=31175 RepID=UPI003B3B2ADC
MDKLDGSSPPPSKRHCFPDDIPPSSIPFDSDMWDSSSFLVDDYPDMMHSMESSLGQAGADSAGGLLGFDFDLHDDAAHLHGMESGGTSTSSFHDIGRIGGAEDLYLMDEEVEDEGCSHGNSEADNASKGDDNSQSDGRVEDITDRLEEREEEMRGEGGRGGGGEDDDVGEETEDNSIAERESAGDGDWNREFNETLSDAEEGSGGDNERRIVAGGGRGEGGGGMGDEEGARDGDGEEEEEEEEGEEWDSDSDGDLDAMLDEALPSEYKQAKGGEEQQKKGNKKARDVWREVVTQGGSLPEGLIGVKEKMVLKKHGQEPLEGLPDGWVRISHQCGMPLYLHRPTRVCTWSRPYLLGSGSARRHHVPVAAIPCLHYSRALEKDKAQAQSNSNQKTDKPNSEDAKETATDNADPSRKLQNGVVDREPQGDVTQVTDQGSKDKGQGSENKTLPQKNSKIHICEDDSVDGKELHEYLERLFRFEKIAIKRFKTWAARRKHTRALKTKDRPHFPGGPKVIRCQIPGNKGREFVINAQDKTPVCILHEYSQRIMRTQPHYIFGESNNANAPFAAVVEIQGTKYGRGEASSKRLAKAEAAKATLDILVPELIADKKPKAETDTEYFDHVAIDDSRIYDLCLKAGQLTPWQVLQEYRQRSHGMADTDINLDIQVKNHQRSEYTLTLGPHCVKGMCKNKNGGKQQGAQKLLKELHPELNSWGAIIKMYGKGSTELNRAKRKAEQSVIELQDGKRHSRPNRKILNKLRTEMLAMYGEEGWLQEEFTRQKAEPGNADEAEAEDAAETEPS